MTTLLVALGSFLGFIVAYHTYGRWISRRIFALDPAAEAPSCQLRDDSDFIPTRKEVIFGHHFTSIAGTGPIVGPAIAVFWGWLPALLWVVFGSIFIGAVHDFGALVVSLRNRGQTVGEIAGRMIAPRAKVLFLLVLALALTIVLAVFGLVIATIFANFPETVLSVWIAMPIAVGVGFWVYRRGGGLLAPSLLALAAVYCAVWVGVYYLPIDLTVLLSIPLVGESPLNAVVVWTLLLLVYCFIASVLPVWVLLQPRDFINSHQLLVAMALLVGGMFVAGWTGQADLVGSAPAVAQDVPADAPQIWPFLFITIACGAVSGFHCLVSSGTSSKQVAQEPDALFVGYGAMLLEGALAVIVILACCAGVGMGLEQRVATGPSTYRYEPELNAGGEKIVGREAWLRRYNANAETGGGWKNFRLSRMVGAFVEGGANFVASLGVPLELAVGIIAVLVASFAATTLDTATRLQRYVIQELAGALRVRPLGNKFAATGVAVGLGGAVALFAGPEPGTGGLVLWPLFGATNQLLAGLAFLVTVFYLWRRGKPVLFALIPMLIMLVMPAWAMLHSMFFEWWGEGKYLLFAFGACIMTLQIWTVIEAILMWPRARGVLEEALPALEPKQEAPREPAMVGGRSC